jgi:hypothetical protein
MTPARRALKPRLIYDYFNNRRHQPPIDATAEIVTGTETTIGQRICLIRGRKA